jgi:hypothetical protein
MFWIGLIAGLVIGIIVGAVGTVVYAMIISGMSYDELCDCGDLLLDASQNRESTIVLYHDDDELGRVVLEDE